MDDNKLLTDRVRRFSDTEDFMTSLPWEIGLMRSKKKKKKFKRIKNGRRTELPKLKRKEKPHFIKRDDYL